MADYFSPTVFTAAIGLTNILRHALEIQGASFEEAEEPETALDGLANGRLPLSFHYVSFSEGWNDGQDADEMLEYIDDIDAVEKELGPEGFNTLKEMLNGDQTDMVYHILEANPDMEMVDVQCGFSCSRMRLDGYGGYGLIANRKGYLFNCSTGYMVEADGTIKPTGEFIEWITPLAPVPETPTPA